MVENDTAAQIASGGSFVVKKAGRLLVLNPDASGFPVKTAGTPAIRGMAERMADTVNLKDYGARGDGVSDDTAAWEAWDKATAGMKYVPAGSYLVDGKVLRFHHGAFFGLHQTLSMEKVYVYARNQIISPEMRDQDAMPSPYSKECIIIKQGDKVVMIDTGGAEATSSLASFCAKCGVDHVDYLIITHYHIDHCTAFSGYSQTLNGQQYSFTNTIDNYIDFSKCHVFLPYPCTQADPKNWPRERMRLSGDYDFYHEYYPFVMQKCRELGLTPVFPKELDALVVSPSLKITFCNAGLDALRETKAASGGSLLVNDASLCVLVEHDDATLFLTGDIQSGAEKRFADKFIERVDDTDGGRRYATPVVAEITGRGGNKICYINDYVNEDGDSIGARYSAAEFYRKIFMPDVYKISHHGVNTLAKSSDPSFWDLMRPREAFVVATTTLKGLDLGTAYRKMSSALAARCPVFSAYGCDVKAVSDGTRFAVIQGVRDAYNKTVEVFQHVSCVQPYSTVAAAGAEERWYSCYRVEAELGDRLGTGRTVSILLHVSDAVGGTFVGLFNVQLVAKQTAGSYSSMPEGCKVERMSYSGDPVDAVGLIHNGGNVFYIVVKQSESAVYTISPLSVSSQESIASITPMTETSWTQSQLEALAQPKWFVRSTPGSLEQRIQLLENSN